MNSRKRRCPSPRNLASPARILVLSLLAYFHTAEKSTTADASTVFGTESGWDVGGTAPLCWESTLTVNPNDATFDNYTSIETLNAELYGAPDAQSAALLPSCYEGTRLTVEPLPLEGQPQFDKQLLTDTKYTFRLTLEANVSNINPDILVRAMNGKSTIHVRLQLCDAIRRGFCNPLWDSRAIDSSLQPTDTDLEAPPGARFPADATKWKYDPESQTLLGVDAQKGDGLLVFMRWCRWTLRQLAPDNPAFSTGIDISFQLPRGGIRTGAYFFLGHAVMNFDLPNQDGLVLRVDVAEAVPGNVVEVRDAPTVRTVSDGMKIAVAVATAVFGQLALLLFAFVVVKRKHPVMRLAQGSFLAALAGACVVQIGCTFTFLPTEDIFCVLSGPLVLVPMTFVGAVCVGRVWRVYKTLSFAQTFATVRGNDKSTWNLSEKFINFLSCLASPALCFAKKKGGGAVKPSRGRNRQSIRVTVTAEETVCLIFMLTLPQLVVQVVASVAFGSELEEQLDPSGNIGHVTCDDETRWAFYFGIAYLAFMYMAAVVVAWISRSLPSAFNESGQIFNAAAISFLLVFITIALIEIMNDPTTHPDVQVFLLTVLSIGVSSSVLLLIVLPKVRRVMSGEKVVVSSILGNRNSISTAPSSGQRPNEFSSSNGTERDYTAGLSPQLRNSLALKSSIKPATYSDATTPSAVTSTSAQHHPLSQVEVRRTVLKEDDPLPEAVEQKILSVQTLLSSATSKLAEGRPLSAEEMGLLQGGVAGLQEELDLVSFEGTNALAATESEMPRAAGKVSVSFHSEEPSSPSPSPSAGKADEELLASGKGNDNGDEHAC